VVFDLIEDELAADVMKLMHDWHAGAAASDPWDAEGATVEFHRQESAKIYRGIGKIKLPWYKRWTLDDADALVRLIKQFYAQEREPGFKEWREKTKKEMRDRIDEHKHRRKAIEDAGEAVRQAQAAQKKRAKAVHERRKASRTRRTART